MIGARLDELKKHIYCCKKYVCPIKTTLERSISFISDISYVSYNIRLTMIGQLATLL